jgi:hypothetical protein
MSMAFGDRRIFNAKIIRLEQAAIEQERLEKDLLESNEAERTALEIIQSDYESGVARDRAAAEYKAKEAQMADQFARESIEGDDQDQGADQTVNPTTYHQNP